MRCTIRSVIISYHFPVHEVEPVAGHEPTIREKDVWRITHQE
jgi:hypothetical protein